MRTVNRIHEVVIVVACSLALGLPAARAQDTVRLRLVSSSFVDAPDNRVYLFGSTIQIHCSVRNTGTATSSSYDATCYLREGGYICNRPHLVGSLTRPSLAPDVTDDFTMTLTLPNDLPARWYNVDIIATCPELSYCDWFNSTEVGEIRLARPAPDLSIQAVDAEDGRYSPGAEIKVKATVSNRGGVNSGAYTVIFSADDYAIGSATRDSLAPQEGETFETTCTLPDDIPDGEYAIEAVVVCSGDDDPDNDIGRDSGLVWVGLLPDLAVQSVEAPEGSYSPGSEIAIYSLVKNLGDRISPSYRLDYYLSIDPEITPQDYLIGSAEREELAPGQQHGYETTCHLPPYLPAGNCYVGAIVTAAYDGRSQNNSGRADTTVTLVHPAGYLCGQIQYKDRPGRQHPVRYAQLEIYEGQDEPGDPEIARTHTDDSGYFGVVMPQAEGQDRPVYLKVRTKGVSGAYPGTTSTIGEVKDDVLGAHYFYRSALYELPAGESLTVTMIIPNTSGGFTAYDSMVEGFHKARTFFGLELDPVTTYCPSSYNGTFYIPGEASIHISEDDWGDRDVILHEYGHFLAEACDFAQGEVGEYNQHYWNSDLRWTPRSHSDAQAQYFAFREAWPTLFSIATQYGDTWYPNAGDTKYQDYVVWADWTIEIDLEADTAAHDSPGRFFENMNCCALWDIFDDHDDFADNNDVLSDTALTKIWTITQECHPNDIEDFWYGWFQHFEHEEEVTRIFLDHEMPFLMRPTATGADFETGDFSIFEWQDTSDTPWIITSEGAYEGAYCARAGAIGDSQSSTLDMTMDCQDGEISFWRKVSSEENWDKLQFYIDGQRKGNWSGELDWEHVSYPVKAGMHRFRWIYVKSGFDSHGEDSAWIDNIEFPVVGATP